MPNRPILTGITWLDEYTGGIHEGGLWVHGSSPGNLKSAFATLVAHEIAILGYRVVYVSFDEHASQVETRFGPMGGVPATLNIINVSGEGEDVNTLLDKATKKGALPSLIVLDNVHLMRSLDEGRFTMRVHINAVVRELRVFADKIPTLALWQFNRSAHFNENGDGYNREPELFPGILYENANLITTSRVHRGGRGVTFNCFHNTYGDLMPQTTVGWDHGTNDYNGLESSPVYVEG